MNENITGDGLNTTNFLGRKKTQKQQRKKCLCEKQPLKTPQNLPACHFSPLMALLGFVVSLGTCSSKFGGVHLIKIRNHEISHEDAKAKVFSAIRKAVHEFPSGIYVTPDFHCQIIKQNPSANVQHFMWVNPPCSRSDNRLKSLGSTSFHVESAKCNIVNSSTLSTLNQMSQKLPEVRRDFPRAQKQLNWHFYSQWRFPQSPL